jgi:NAD(P)-dependent dehydrogenase (short-subunit alcohol dehydrogenase family)
VGDGLPTGEHPSGYRRRTSASVGRRDHGGDHHPEARTSDDVVREIIDAGGAAIANYDTIATPEGGAAIVECALDTFGRIDIVVNVAGILRDRMIFNMSEEEWDAVSAVHLNGTFNTVKHAAARFRQQRSGRFINFSSVSAFGSPGQPNYGAAKYGILGLTAVLANSMNRYGVTSNAILPYAATRMIDSTPRAAKVLEETGKLPSELAAGTEGDPFNVAPMVAYLATDDAQGINGQFFGVHGTQIQLYSHWEVAAAIRAESRWDPKVIAELFDDTLGRNLELPEQQTVPGRDRPQRGTAVWQQDPSQWEAIGPGVEVWTRTRYFEAKGQGA